MYDKKDVVIVGAGPAGLAAAYELSSITDLSVSVVDKGKSIGERECSSIEGLCADHDTCDVTHGSGGAGLFSDGKFCLDPNVGGDISKFYGYEEVVDFMNRFTDMFDLDKSLVQAETPSGSHIKSLRNEFGKNGLGFKYYDVARLGLQERINSVKSLERYLENKGVEFCFDTEVSDFCVGDPFKVETSRGEIYADHLVMAPGKVGSNWLHERCESLGIGSDNNPLYLGVRLELPRDVTKDLASITDNPKISMKFPNEDYIKTHCFSDKGKVVMADYDGLKLVDGNYLENSESDNAAVNIIMCVNLPENVVPYNFSKRFVEQVNSFGNGRPVIQRVGDLFEFNETESEALKDISVDPTLNDCKGGDLSNLYSVRFADRFSRFIKRVDEVVSGFGESEHPMYAPFCEWWMKKIHVDGRFETKVPGLYAIGDGAGMSQGIVAGGMQGIACGRGINEKETRKTYKK